MYRFSIAAQSPSHGISNLELTDGCFGLSLADMNGVQIEAVRCHLLQDLARVVLYTTDMPVSDVSSYVRFFRNAHLIQAENILLSSAALAQAPDSSIREILAMGASFSIRVLFRPDADFPLERYAALRNDWTGLFYDPVVYVRQHQNPYRDILYKCRFKDDIRFLRVCDMVFDTLEPVLPEHGNAQIKECAATLLTRHYPGYFSFGPYGGPAIADVIATFCKTLSLM